VLERCDGSFEHVPNFICVLRFMPWMIWVSIVNSGGSLSMRSGKPRKLFY